MEPKTWVFELTVTSGYLWLHRTFEFEIVADEREAQIFLDIIVQGAEKLGVKIGGGMRAKRDE
jgi:hypothetical protein